MVPLGATFRKACLCDKKGVFMFISLGKWFGLFFFLIDKFFSFALFSIMKKKAVYSGS